ncbi:MAG TPA: hypothetical protein VH350_02610 [Candidatus Sulfotelmatobacter sp.]|jgi:hypothetical protein|nr:hypothetical protein [Candidatus Sulfotelmatobacter sp.]
METVSGVFKTREAAARVVQDASKAGVPADKITLLTPGSLSEVDREMESVPVDTAEQPGMGKAIGALLGGGVGITGGSLLVALIPGVGPITAIGLLGAAIVGAAGATVGASVGGRMEKSTTEGLPEDEIYVYEDALRQGRSVVVAVVENGEPATALRELMKTEGAESVDAAREQWWIGLRSAEESHYSKMGKNFANDEKYYRLGFQAALHARTRCMEFDQVSGEMNAALEDAQREHPGVDLEEAFTRGYQRGRDYYQQLCDEKTKAA